MAGYKSSYAMIKNAVKFVGELSENNNEGFENSTFRTGFTGRSSIGRKMYGYTPISNYSSDSADGSSDNENTEEDLSGEDKNTNSDDRYESNANDRYSMDSSKLKSGDNVEKQAPDQISLELDSSNIAQAYIYSEIFGKPKCKRRRGGAFGVKGYNRR